MYPLLLKPHITDYLWGGTKLKTDFGFETEKEIAAEAWVLSCHKDGANTVCNGELKGKTLPEVLEIWGKEALGENSEKFPYFPILTKLIDAKQSLSVQVHPDDKYALENEGEFGKTEMWYIVDCEEGAELIYGFKKDISKKEFKRRIEDNTLTEVCNNVPVKKGDVFLITAGTLHAIGKGILIAEVQQNSNSTYRVYDYGRVGADGKPRELHIEKALDVTVCKKPILPYGNIGDIEVTPFGSHRPLVNCDLFSTSIYNLDGQTILYNERSFVSLLILDGNAKITYKSYEIDAKKGDSIFIPANIKAEIKGTATILRSLV